jgi:DNA-binding response OmpR family regulator
MNLLLDNKNHKRIMIIDDDVDITNLFKIFLEGNGYNIDAYTSPIEGIKNFRKNSHDLILLDLKMPEMNGMTLYRKIKEIDDTVVVCLSTADKNYIQELQKDILDVEKTVIYKPILLRDLKNRIDSLLHDKESKSMILTN